MHTKLFFLIFEMLFYIWTSRQENQSLGLRTTKAQTSLHIGADSEHLWKVIITSKLPLDKRNSNFLVSVAESHLRGNPEDLFCHVKAHIFSGFQSV